MSYIRGDYYFWSDGSEFVHFWAANGYDGWDQSVWAVDEEGKRHEDRHNACGVGIPKMKMDEFVVMRLAEMIKAGRGRDRSREGQLQRQFRMRGSNSKLGKSERNVEAS